MKVKTETIIRTIVLILALINQVLAIYGKDKIPVTEDEIYQLILDLANNGKTVLMVSSEMPELLGVCDRIIVMSGGRVAGEVDAKNTTQEEIMTLAAKYV